MKRRLKNVSIIVRNSLILLIILEIILGFTYNFRIKKKYDDYIDHIIDSGIHNNMNPTEIKSLYYEYESIKMKWAPFIHYTPEPFTGVYNTINNLGQRNTVQPTKKNTTTYKIFCFGGSTMYGMGSTDSGTIPSELSKIISKKLTNKNIEVTNFGCPGYTRDIEHIQLQQELNKGNIPNLVIFYDGVNEVISSHQNNGIGFPMNVAHRRSEFFTSKNYYKKIAFFLKSSYTNRLIKYIRKKVLPKPPSIKRDPKELSRKIAANYINHINISEVISDLYNFDIINILQPTIFTKNKLSDYEKVIVKNENKYKDFYHHTYSNIKKDSIFIKNCNVIDMSLDFNSEDQTIFTDFCHTTKKGNKMIAQNIHAVIKLVIEN